MKNKYVKKHKGGWVAPYCGLWTPFEEDVIDNETHYGTNFKELFEEIKGGECGFVNSEIEGTFKCRCGNSKLTVGFGDYLTVVKCPLCGREETVHSG